MGLGTVRRNSAGCFSGICVALVLLSACGVFAPAPVETLAPPAAAPTATPLQRAADPGSMAARFDENRAMEHVRVLARPEFMGRHTGTPGEVLGAQYLADQLRSFGVRPAGSNGTYIQEFPIKVTEFSAVPELTLIEESGRQHALRLRDDFRPLIGGQAGPGAVEGPGFFGGAGDFSSQDVKGKVVLIVPRGRLRDIIDDARAAGALALIATSGQDTLLKGESQEPASSGTLPLFIVSTRGSAALLEGSGRSREDLNQRIRAGEPLPTFPLAFRVRLSSQVETRPVNAKNVMGLLPAATTTEESCVVGAHYEEIGPDPDGVVFPAANDNASGTAVMLEIARLLADQKVSLKLNVVFIGWSGHEEGLHGSAYYVDNPVYPIDKTRCYINLDTVGQGSGQALFADIPEGRLRSTLEAALDRLQAATGVRPLVEISQQGVGASDHLNFVDRAVPSIDFNWTGIFEGGRIHVPEDDASNVDPQKLKVTGQVATAVLLTLAAEAP